MSEVASAVVIIDGSVASLVAAWREMLRVTAGFASGSSASAGVLGSVMPGSAGGEKASVAKYLIGFVPAGLAEGQRAAAMRIIEMTGMSRVVAGGTHGAEGVSERGPEVRLAARGLDATEMLLGAGALAMDRGMERVVWPICTGALAAGHLMQAGEDWASRRGEVMAEIFDRGLLVGRLLSIDVPAGRRAITVQTPLLELSDEQLVDLAGDLDAPAGRAWWRQEDHAAWRALLGASGLLSEAPAVSAAKPSGQWTEGKPLPVVAEQAL